MSLAAKFSQFVRQQRQDLRRIALRTQGEFTYDDVEQESFLVAQEIERRRGYAIDYEDVADQKTVLAWLHNKLVKFADKQLRYAVKLDRDWDTEEGEFAPNALARLLTAPLDSDPAVWIQQRQEQLNWAAMVQRSYSQASAYVLLLIRFDWEMEDLAVDLRVAPDTLRRRLKVAGIKVKCQPSLFDGLSEIDAGFEPVRARCCAAKPVFAGRGFRQRVWRF